MPYNGIEAITIDGSSNVWMSFIGTAGIVVFPDGKNDLAKYIKQDSIPGFPKGAVYIKSLAVDLVGNLWAGTAKQGVVRINSGGATIFSRQTTGIIKNDTIHSVTIDACGHVWIGTEGGACMYDGTTWYSFTNNSGHLLNDHVFMVKADALGHVWIGTKGGLTEFKPLPNAPQLLAPLMNMTMNSDSVRCSWVWACPGITNYWYEIADNDAFLNARIDTTSLSMMENASILDT
jgi:ligand-binding sensor domain-containing protein